jgi:hypothetical protein
MVVAMMWLCSLQHGWLAAGSGDATAAAAAAAVVIVDVVVIPVGVKPPHSFEDLAI